MQRELFVTRKKAHTKKPIPHNFVLEYLASAAPYTRPMFGCTAVYIGEKIFFILREKDSARRDNGLWIATAEEHHASLRDEFPNMRSISIFGGTSNWQVLPSDSPDFEEAAIRACELALQRDPRIGKVPNSRRAAARKKKPVPQRKTSTSARKKNGRGPKGLRPPV